MVRSQNNPLSSIIGPQAFILLAANLRWELPCGPFDAVAAAVLCSRFNDNHKALNQAGRVTRFKSRVTYG